MKSVHERRSRNRVSNCAGSAARRRSNKVPYCLKNSLARILSMNTSAAQRQGSGAGNSGSGADAVARRLHPLVAPLQGADLASIQNGYEATVRGPSFTSPSFPLAIRPTEARVATLIFVTA